VKLGLLCAMGNPLMSQNHIDPDLAIEVFVLEPAESA
jgi:hypothetical protein